MDEYNNNISIDNEEKTNNIIRSMGEKFYNLINSFNFKSNDNIELDSKINRINKELELVTNKMKNGN